MVERLPSAQGVILESGIESHIGLPAGSLLLPLPVSLPFSLSLALSLSLSHKLSLLKNGIKGNVMIIFYHLMIIFYHLIKFFLDPPDSKNSFLESNKQSQHYGNRQKVKHTTDFGCTQFVSINPVFYNMLIFITC